MFCKFRQCLKALIITLFLNGMYLHAATLENSDSEVCMAQAIYFESRGGSELDMKDVGQVVLNRVNSSKFPNSVCGVVYQRYRGTCQFSWVCHSHSIREPKEYEKSLRYANEILTSEYTGTRIDRTNGALFFENKSSHTNWRKKPIFKNNQHVFYK